MSLSKVLKYSTIGLVSFMVAGEIYYKLVENLKKMLGTPDENENVYESFCTQCSFTRSTSYIMRQIRFQRGNLHFITEILETLIMSAERQIHVAMYIFTNSILFDALKKVMERGVKVFVIVDHSMVTASGSQVESMQKCGMNLKIYSKATLHHKFCLIDSPDDNKMEMFIANHKVKGKKEDSSFEVSSKKIKLPKNGLLITGSLNWTREAMLSNVENFIVTSDKNLIMDYQKFFNDCWTNNK